MRFFSRSAPLFAGAMLGLALGAQAQAPGIQQIQSASSVPPVGHRAPHHPLRKVIVLLSGDSIAAVQSRAGRTLSESERAAIRAARAGEHARLKPEIERRGGQVLGDLRAALNGIKVLIPQDRIEELRKLPGVVSVKAVDTLVIHKQALSA